MYIATISKYSTIITITTKPFANMGPGHESTLRCNVTSSTDDVTTVIECKNMYIATISKYSTVITITTILFANMGPGPESTLRYNVTLSTYDVTTAIDLWLYIARFCT